MLKKTNVIVFVTGRKQSGKSYFSDAFSSYLYSAGHRIVIVDPMSCFELCGAPILYNLSDVLQLEDGRSFVFRPKTDGSARQFLEYAQHLEKTVLVVDEIDMYCPANYDYENPILQIVRYGRHSGLSLIGISQRPANVARDITAQSDYMVIFHTVEANDVLYLTQRLNKSMVQEVTDLPPRECRIYSAVGSFVSYDDFRADFLSRLP